MTDNVDSMGKQKLTSMRVGLQADVTDFDFFESLAAAVLTFCLEMVPSPGVGVSEQPDRTDSSQTPRCMAHPAD